MQDTLSAVPIKHERINSGCLQKGGGGKVLSEKPVAFLVLGSCCARPTLIYKHTCAHISITDIKTANKYGQVLSQPDKARQVKELDFRASTAHLRTRELLSSS